MERRKKSRVVRFPATQGSDTIFGALIGSILGAAVACFLTRSQEMNVALPVVLSGLVLGSAIGAVVGFLDHNNRDNFSISQLGVKLGIGFFLLPSVALLLGGLGLIDGRKSGLLVLTVGFGGVMLGLLIGSCFDRIYESVLRRRNAKEG